MSCDWPYQPNHPDQIHGRIIPIRNCNPQTRGKGSVLYQQQSGEDIGRVV